MTREDHLEYLLDRINELCVMHGVPEEKCKEILADVYAAAEAWAVKPVQVVPGRVLSFKEKFEQRERFKRFQP
jgi:hypothetical protein